MRKRVFIIASFLMMAMIPSVIFAQDFKEFLQKASQASASGNHKEAVEFYQKAIEANPNYAPAYNALGMAYNALGMEPHEFIWCFNMAVGIDPKYAQAYENLGKAYYGLKNFDKAEEYCKKALSLNPQLTSAQFALAWVYLLGKSQPDRAAYYFQKVIEKKQIPRAYLGLGIAYFMNGQPEMTIGVITDLRGMKQDTLAAQLENMIRDNKYVPGNVSSLIGNPLPVERKKGVIVKSESSGQDGQDPLNSQSSDLGGQVTRVRLKGKMINTGGSLKVGPSLPAP